MTEANRRFHFAILEASGMPRLIRIIRNLWDSTDAYRSVYYNATSNRARVEREHRDIVAAVQHRDAAELVRLLAVHRDHAVKALREIIATDETPDGPSGEPEEARGGEAGSAGAAAPRPAAGTASKEPPTAAESGREAGRPDGRAVGAERSR
jgi:hypothetical protein